MGERNFKIVLLGEGSVGKTSLVTRYTSGDFNPQHVTTIQASFLTKRLNIDGERVKLAIWDTAGQERFHALGPIYYRDSHGALLVYDITDQDSFQKVQNWVKELRKMLGTEVQLCVVGNKCDLEKNRTVPLRTAEEYAESVGAVHYSTSAKLDKGLNEMFYDLSTRMMKANQASARSAPAQRQSRSDLLIDFEESQTQRGGGPNGDQGCC